MFFQLTIDDIVNSNLLEQKSDKIFIEDNPKIEINENNRGSIYTSIVSKRKGLFRLEDFDEAMKKIGDRNLELFFSETSKNQLNKILLNYFTIKGLTSFISFTDYRDYIKYKILEKTVAKSSEPEEIVRSEKLIKDLKNLLSNKKIESDNVDDDKWFKFFSSIVNNFTKNFIRDTKVNTVFSISSFGVETESIINKGVGEGIDNLMEENQGMGIPRELIGIKINGVSPYKIIELAIKKFDFNFLLENLEKEEDIVKSLAFTSSFKYINNKFSLIAFYTDWFVPFIRKLKEKKNENFCYVCKDIDMFLSTPIIKSSKTKNRYDEDEENNILEDLEEIPN